MQTFIEEYLPYVIAALSALCSLLNFLYSRHTGKSLHVLEDNVNMKYRKADYREKIDSPKQKFSPFVKTYKYDYELGDIVEDEPLDIDKLVASHLESSLEKMLDRFMPVDVTDKIGVQVDETSSDLGAIGDAFETLNEYREKLGLDAFMPLDQVYDAVVKYRDEQAAALKAVQAAKANPTPAPSPVTVESLQTQLAALQAKLSEVSEHE